MKYIIIGAVAGGASTAARLRRLNEHAEIVIFEKGEYISYANCGLPYYIGDVIKDRNKLFVQTATSFAKRFNVDVRINSEVIKIYPGTKSITVTNLETLETYEESYDKLVLSPGANPIRPALPGIHFGGIFTVRNVGDTDHIKNYIQQSNAKKAVIIGAGFIGLEMAENLKELGLDISIIEMGNQILAPVDAPIAAVAQKHLKEKGIHLYLNTAVTGFSKNDNSLQVLSDKGTALDADIVILSIGVRPDTTLAAGAGLELGPANGIKVNEYLQTSNPDIYAVGDAIEFPNPISGKAMVTYLAGPANKQGRICANNLALGNKHTYQGSVNTAIVKLFDLTAGAAGMSSKQLEANNIKHITSTIHANSHAGYYPGAELMTIQLTFSPDDGLLFGAQIIGREGVDKRLDVLSSFIQNKNTIFELADFEQAYAPPFSSAKDPINMAGFVAENIILERLNIIGLKDVVNIKKDDILLDVRTAKEFASGTIEGALNLPLDEVRDRLAELPKDKVIYIFCQQGMRGYLAQRILVQNGYDNVYNLSGGYLLYKTWLEETPH